MEKASEVAQLIEEIVAASDKALTYVEAFVDDLTTKTNKLKAWEDSHLRSVRGTTISETVAVASESGFTLINKMPITMDSIKFIRSVMASALVLIRAIPSTAESLDVEKLKALLKSLQGFCEAELSA